MKATRSIAANRLKTRLSRITIAGLTLATVVTLAIETTPAAEPETMSLWNGKAPVGDGTFTDEDPQLTIYRPENPNGTAIVICPGGGYGGHAIQPEGHGIAKWLNRHGLTGVVLKYRLPKGRTMVPLLDGRRAIQMTRSHAKQWSLATDRIGVMGFSAGGHLASTCATQFVAANNSSDDAIEHVSSRPDFAVLIYPVITMGEKTHGGSKRNLLGANPSAELQRSMSSELRVTRETPPTFLAHAVDDRPVPSINSQLFHDALKAKGVATRYLELPNGGHGLNGYKGPSWDAWQKQSLQWIADVAKPR